MFDEMLPASGREDVGLMDWRPTVDTFEQENAIVVKAELPGVNKEDVSINVHQSVLTLSGERKRDEEVKEEKYYRRERFYGKFQRSFTLPENIDPDKIFASFKDGVLEVRIPRTEKSQAKRIEIK